MSGGAFQNSFLYRHFCHHLHRLEKLLESHSWSLRFDRLRYLDSDKATIDLPLLFDRRLVVPSTPCKSYERLQTKSKRMAPWIWNPNQGALQSS